jgi:branched-chain amino acid aminotransferase
MTTIPTSTREQASAEATDGPGYAYIDGDFCPISEAKIPLMDWAILRSDATYDVIRVSNGRFFRLDDHLARLRRGTELLGMQIAPNWSEVGSILAECVERSGLETCAAYAIVSRGVPPLGMLRDPRLARNRLYAMAVPIPWIIDPDDDDRALGAGIGGRPRIDPDSVDPTIKNFHWQDLVQSLLGVQMDGADTTILLDRNGNVTEGPGLNVFIVSDGGLRTPDRGVLEGITRRSVLEIAEQLGLGAETRTVTRRELQDADEVFGTSTAGGIVPIGKLDGEPIGDGRPGPVTRKLRTELRKWYSSPEHTASVSDVRVRGDALV